MISNLDDLIAFTNQLGQELPALRDSIVIEQPGCTQDEIDKVAESLPGIPESYLAIAKQVRLLGIAIGYFQLTPNSYQGLSLCEKLLDCNLNSGMRNRFERDCVYQIGSWEADPIAIAYQSGQYERGQVLKYNAGNPEEDATVLADSYDHFLLLAGNLDCVRDKFADADYPAEGMPEFEQCVARIAPGREEVWMSIAEVVLS